MCGGLINNWNVSKCPLYSVICCFWLSYIIKWTHYRENNSCGNHFRRVMKIWECKYEIRFNMTNALKCTCKRNTAYSVIWQLLWYMLTWMIQILLVKKLWKKTVHLEIVFCTSQSSHLIFLFSHQCSMLHTWAVKH